MEYKDPIECFQIATTFIAEGDFSSALPLMECASEVMAGDSDFDSLHKLVKDAAK